MCEVSVSWDWREHLSFVLGLRGDFCDGLKRPEVEIESSWTILFDFCLRTINKAVR